MREAPSLSATWKWTEEAIPAESEKPEREEETQGG